MKGFAKCVTPSHLRRDFARCRDCSHSDGHLRRAGLFAVASMSRRCGALRGWASLCSRRRVTPSNRHGRRRPQRPRQRELVAGILVLTRSRRRQLRR